MKRFYRILSICLCVTLLLPAFAMTIFAVAPAMSRAVPDAPAELSALSQYLHASVSTEDNTSHLPVNIHTYYDENKQYVPATIGEAGSVSILYVMNTNTERLGNKTDAELVQSFLDRGYFVIVLDYQNNPAACGTALDWSTQDIRCQVIGGNPFKGGKVYTAGTYTDGKLAGTDPICAQSYILPAGYDIAHNIPYFSYDKHGTAGTFELIVEIWNNDFKSVKRNTIVKWVDENGLPRLNRTEAITEKAASDSSNINYATWFKTADGKNGISQSALEALSDSQKKQYQYTYIGNTKVVDVTDCVQPDGTMIDLNLYCDIIYPANYTEQLPVMITMSSGYTRASSWSDSTRPYLNGPLFNGYVGVLSDYGLVPMCRNDHYGYFCGDSQLNSISGDNGTYSLSYYNGIHSDTALLRTLRKIGVEGMDVEGYGYVSAPINPDKIGAYGNSKGGVIVRLANPTPEKLQELRCFEGHNGETRLEAYENNYPYVDPYISNGATTDARIDYPEAQPVLTYSNGQTIHSGLNFVFANCGGASNTLTEGSAPIFGVGTQAGKAEGSYYTYYQTTANLARNLDIPFFGLVAPTIAHDLGYGTDRDYGLDILESFNRYANYWLKDDNVECIIIDVDTTKDICAAADVIMDNIYEISPDSSIKLQFTGSVSESEIEKVQIISLSTGEELNGAWQGSYGDQQWKFIPYDIQDSTYYTINVPASLSAKNGKPIKEAVTHTFRTSNGVTENNVTISQLKHIKTIDCKSLLLNDQSLGGAATPGLGWSGGGIYGTTDGFDINLFRINAASYNTNQNVRFHIFNDIWKDSSYIGKTVRFSFEAKAKDVSGAGVPVSGEMKLSLGQGGTGNKYVWGTGLKDLDATASLTGEWQTFTFEFVVTKEMFDGMSDGTISSPGLGLALKFPGFVDVNTKTYDKVSIHLRNVNVSALASVAEPELSTKDPLYFTFPEKDYSTAHNVDLRFAVENDAINTVGIYGVSAGALGEKLGEVLVAGAGIYNFNVTDYVKRITGAPVVAVKLEKSVGSTTLKDFDYETSNTGIGFNALAKYVITDEIPNSDGTANTSAKVEYGIRSAYYIDLDGNLVSKYTGSLYQFAASTNGFKAGAFTEADYGRRFRVTFRVYDETSRVVNVYNGDGYNFDAEIADFKGSNYSFYTTAGEWTTVTVEFTVDDEAHLNEAIRSHIFFFYAENKSVAALDPDVAVNVRNMAAATTKPGNYAGAAGLNDSYTVYSNANAVADAGKVTYYEDLSYGLYIDDIIFEEVTTGVNLASTAPMLSITPTTSGDILPTVSSSVLSTAPNDAQDGLWIGGGQDGFDTLSVKSYVKLSLEEYIGGYAAFLFNATGTANANVSVYGVSNVSAGQNWNSSTITSATAPANDIYGAGVNLNAVWNNAPLATFAVSTATKTCTVDISDFAEAMRKAGAEEITLIIVSDAKNVTRIEILDKSGLKRIDSFDCTSTTPLNSASGYTLIKSNQVPGTYPVYYPFYSNTSEGLQVDLRAIVSGVTPNPNARLFIFEKIWDNTDYIGKTVRFSFMAKASTAGAIALSLNQYGSYTYNNFPGFSGTANLTENWQTFTYEFVVTEAMYGPFTVNSTGQENLALGVRFTNFSDDGSKYNGAQITFRNFTVSTVEEESDKHITTRFDFDSTKPDMTYSGYSGSTLYSMTDGALQINAGNITNVSDGQNFRAFVFNEVFGSHTENIGKTFRVIFRAKATEAGQLDLSLNSTGGAANAFSIYPGHSYSFNLTEEYQTFEFSFKAEAGMYDRNTYNDLALGIRIKNGFYSGSAYKKATIYIDSIVVAENPYVRSVDVEYDYESKTPTSNFSGYSNQTSGSVKNGEYQVNPSLNDNCNSGQYLRVFALNEIWQDTSNTGKKFTVSFRAKATEAGVMDFGINKDGTFNLYSYDGTTYSQECYLTTEYQTFTYTFTAIDNMFTTNETTRLVCAFRFYNGFRDTNASSAKYKDVTIYIDDLHVYQDLDLDASTVIMADSEAISGSGNSDMLTVYADDSATGAPKIQKTYIAYNLTSVSASYGARLNVKLSGSNGETVRVYVLSDTTLPKPLTYANAPTTTNSAAASFVAVDGDNYVDIGDAIAVNSGKNIVIILSIEEPSDAVQITAAPELEIVQEYHNHTSEEQRHAAVAPTYTTPGNIEFYSCQGCGKLYVKNGEQFVEVSAEDVTLPALKYENTAFSGASLNIGKDLSVRYHVALAAGECISDYTVRFTMNGKSVTVSANAADPATGKYIFTYCGVAPQCMGDNISAVLLKNGVVVDTKEEYSVKTYVQHAIESYPDYTELHQLLSDMLHYGAAAQEYLQYKTNDLVTEGVDIPAASTVIPGESDNNKSASTASGNVKFTAAGVRFGHDNRIYVKLTASDLNGVTVSVNGQKLEIAETDKANVYIAYSDGISALKFSDKVTFTLSSGGTVLQTLTYTVNDYALSKYNDAEIGELALALYRYGKSAVAYNETL